LKEVGYVIPFAQNLTSDIVKEDGTCSFCKKEEKHLKKKPQNLKILIGANVKIVKISFVKTTVFICVMIVGKQKKIKFGLPIN
jgi:hypothetical protein